MGLSVVSLLLLPLREWYGPLSPCRSPLLYSALPEQTETQRGRLLAYTLTVERYTFFFKYAYSRDGHYEREADTSEKTLPNCVRTQIERLLFQITSPPPPSVPSVLALFYPNTTTTTTGLGFLFFFPPPPPLPLPTPSSSWPSHRKEEAQSDEFAEKRRRR